VVRKLHELEMDMRQSFTRLGSSLAAVLALTASSAAFAQTTTTLPDNYTPPAHESCCKGAAPPYGPNAVPNPDGLLGTPANQPGNGQLISSVRDVLLSDSGSLSGVLGLLKNATPEQKLAIASGVAQAAKLWNTTDPNYSLYMQRQVALTGDQGFILAYSTASGNAPIGAGGGGGGGGGGAGGGVGGQTNSLSTGFFGTGSASGIGGSGTNTGAFTMTGGVTAGSFNGSTTTTSP
jgi:hypothetical protein